MWKYWGRGIDRYREGRRGRYWKNEDVGGGHLLPESLAISLPLENRTHEKFKRATMQFTSGNIPFSCSLSVQTKYLPKYQIIYWCGKKASLTKKRKRGNNNRCKSAFKYFQVLSHELKTLEWDILNPELKTLEWWISGLRLNPLFFLISRLNIAWKTHDINLKINYSTGYLDISF